MTEPWRAHLELLRSIAPDLALRARLAWQRRDRADDVPKQLPSFVAMTDDVALDVELPLRVEHGAVPAGLDALYAAGGWFRTPDHRIRHLLDAYSCAIGARIRPDGPTVRVKRLADPLYDAEQRAGRVLRKGLFTPMPPGLGRVTHVMGRHAVHDVVAWDGKLCFTAQNRYVWLDPVTFEERDVDLAAALGPESVTRQLDMHPQVDSESGRMLTHAYAVGPTFTTSYRFAELDASGPPRVREYRWPSFLAPHAFGFTREHMLLVGLPARYQPIRFLLGLNRGALDGATDDPHGGVVLHVVPRDASREPFTAHFAMQGFVYHLTNAYEDGDTLVADAFVSNLNPERESSQFELDVDRPVWTNLGGVFRLTVDLRTRACSKRLIVPGLQRVTFDAIDESRRGRAYRHAWFCANDQHEGRSSQVISADVATGSTTRWATSEPWFLRQPRFVARSAEEGDGWLLAPAYGPDATRFLVFEARDVGRGPVAVLSAGRRLPYSNHGWALPMGAGARS